MDVNQIAAIIVSKAKKHYDEENRVEEYMLDFEMPADGFMYYAVCWLSCKDYITYRDNGDYYQPPEIYGYSNIEFELESFGACDADGYYIPCAITKDDIQTHLNGTQLRYDF